ncbi:hypothetical protein NDU88_001167 [Pleurodeles waltl]|uniref:Uncharacterized protein n=1 Tax=Pleurodeles waltl TaxID=8319 RepID=A0AAV7LF51_PLEWA|nr:hypothetical protein NDU88_001167 [Pleurodeles waltl]
MEFLLSHVGAGHRSVFGTWPSLLCPFLCGALLEPRRIAVRTPCHPRGCLGACAVFPASQSFSVARCTRAQQGISGLLWDGRLSLSPGPANEGRGGRREEGTAAAVRHQPRQVSRLSAVRRPPHLCLGPHAASAVVEHSPRDAPFLFFGAARHPRLSRAPRQAGALSRATAAPRAQDRQVSSPAVCHVGCGLRVSDRVLLQAG